MNIFVDADACPVKEIIVKTARKFSIPVTMICDTSHILEDGYSNIINVDKSKDSADFVLINLIKEGDIVVTQDYGVGCLAISKNAYALNQNGLLYSSDNIDRLLFERYLSNKVRKAGEKTRNVRKRTKEDDDSFERSFLSLIKRGILYGTKENKQD